MLEYADEYAFFLEFVHHVAGVAWSNESYSPSPGSRVLYTAHHSGFTGIGRRISRLHGPKTVSKNNRALLIGKIVHHGVHLAQMTSSIPVANLRVATPPGAPSDLQARRILKTHENAVQIRQNPLDTM
jgi:hypothetical protein